MKRLKRIFFATITVLISLVLADLLLHAGAAFSPRINELVSVISAKIPDATLGHRPNPAYPGHDENGFRNPSVPTNVDVVALGDSHTYGSGVESDQAWPRALEKLSGRSVYNMGLGGYGPVHSLLLWEEATAFGPELIIEGIYAGNDLHDSFSIVHKRGIMPELKSEDKAVQDTIREAETTKPIREQISKTYRRGKQRSNTYKSIKAWLSNHSKIFRLLRRTQYELSQIRKRTKSSTLEERWQKAKKRAAKNPQYMTEFSSNSARTIFTSEYRLTALNLDDPRIREGLHISLEAIQRMQQLARRDGIRFIVLLIPTKEFVFSEQAKNIAAPNYHTLVQNERQFWELVKSYLEMRSIEFIDAVPPLQSELEAGAQPYKVSHGGHPNEHGQHTIAKAVYDYLVVGKQAVID